MALEIRAATQAEMGQMALLGAYVYAGSFGDDEDGLIATANRPEWTLCAFDGSRMVASFATIPFNMRAMGQAIPMGGITTVGTLPEYRRQGILRTLMTRSLQMMREQQRPVTSLWASQAAIYQRYGFSLASVMRRYAIDTVDIGFSDGDSGSCRVTRENVADCFDDIKACYATFAAERMCYLHRASTLWQRTILEAEGDGPVHVAVARNDDGVIQGYLVYTMRAGRVSHPARSQDLKIRDLAWQNADAYRSLWQFVSRHDLVGKVSWDSAPQDDPAMELFMEPRLLNVVDTEGLWFRIVDVPPALAGRGYACDGELVIEVADDGLAPWNVGRWHLTVTNGVGAVDQTDATPDITVSVKALASLYTGYRTATALNAWDLLEGDTAAVVIANQLFQTYHAPHCPDHF
jgi:predicted acetyltransferase